MSKQTKAKEVQGYVPKAIPQTCGNCAHRQFERVDKNAEFIKANPESGYSSYWQDVNQRCGIGGFAVKKMGTCNEWAGKVESGA